LFSGFATPRATLKPRRTETLSKVENNIELKRENEWSSQYLEKKEKGVKMAYNRFQQLADCLIYTLQPFKIHGVLELVYTVFDHLQHHLTRGVHSTTLPQHFSSCTLRIGYPRDLQ
jgi:hypothetical protein